MVTLRFPALGLCSYLDPSDPGLFGTTDGEFFCGLCQVGSVETTTSQSDTAHPGVPPWGSALGRDSAVPPAPPAPSPWRPCTYTVNPQTLKSIHTWRWAGLQWAPRHSLAWPLKTPDTQPVPPLTPLPPAPRKLQASVARTSKHCRACDRCVMGFDHHCKWLNNCVGQRNYKHFFALVTSTVSLLVVQFAWGLWLFIRSFRDKDEMRQLVADKYGRSVNYSGWQAALALYMAMLITAVVMLGELFFFHIVLISKGMTTYDYIIAQRDEKLAQQQPAAARGGLLACRSGKVADASTAKRKVRVGINPCAAIKTSKPKGNPASWDAAKVNGKAAPLGSGGSGKLSGSSGSLPLSGSLNKAGSSSSVRSKGSVMAAAAGSVEAMVSRAVAEQQGRPSATGSEADSALLKKLQVGGPDALRSQPGLHSPGACGGGGGGGGGGVRAQGCVPECGGHGDSPDRPSAGYRGGAGPGAGGDEFTALHAARGSPPQQHSPPEGPQHGGAEGGAGRGQVGGVGGFDAAGGLRRPGSGMLAAAGGSVAAGGRHLGGHAAAASPAGAGGQGSTGASPAVSQGQGQRTTPPARLPPILLPPASPRPSSGAKPSAARRLENTLQHVE